jgi:Flp pilus assembly protein TadG
VAALEFAVVVPVLLLVFLAGADLTLFMRMRMQLDQVTEEVALTVTQYQDLYDSDFTALFNAAQTIAGRMPVTGQFATTIISGIVNSGGRQTIAWQRRSPSATFTSQFGASAGAAALLPGGYVLPSGTTLIAVEIFTPASPWVLSASLMGGSGTSSIRSYALFQPRLGSLATVNAGSRP